MRYLYRGILSSRRPVRKQPSMEPRELIMRRKEIWPRLTPTYSTVQYSTDQYRLTPTRSFRSSRVGPITPSVRPSTGT